MFIPIPPYKDQIHLKYNNPADGVRHRKFEADRTAALESPLRSGLRYTLDVAIPQQRPQPHRRVPTLASAGYSARNVSLTLELVDGLQTDVGRFSQVWTAKIIGAPTETLLVLKILQPSLCLYPDSGRSWVGYTHPDDLAGSEAWAYEILDAKQGLWLPYFFGLQTVRVNKLSLALNLTRSLIRLLPRPTNPPRCSSSNISPVRHWQNSHASGTSRML